MRCCCGRVTKVMQHKTSCTCIPSGRLLVPVALLLASHSFAEQVARIHCPFGSVGCTQSTSNNPVLGSSPLQQLGHSTGDPVAMAEAKVFTLEQVSGHNHAKDCWLIIDGKVYDVTKFLDDHPGGDEVLLSATGKDATDDFEDVGHSTSARDMMDEYYVGDIDPTSFPDKPTFTPAKQAAYNPDKSSEFLIKILQFVVPLAILALAVAVRFLTKNEDVKSE